jgi:hypothetical protein
LSQANRPSNPAETAARAIGGQPKRESNETEVQDIGQESSTNSYKPAKPGGGSEATKDDEAYILEREPDGRYRIIGRKERKPK